MARRQQPLLARLTPMQRIWIALAILAIAVLFSLFRSRPQQPPSEPMEPLANRNVRFGMPAKADAVNKDAYLIEREQYVLSYNNSKGISNWVCWNVNKADIGKAERSSFHRDSDLPPSFFRVTPDDYDHSGFDRGHICPSKDRSSSPEFNKPTFTMTNMVPQAPKCNQQCWKDFEDYCRTLTNDGSELYITAGPNGEGGEGLEGAKVTIGRSEPITVPASVWKVVMVLPNKDALPTSTTRTLAVWMPNNQGVDKKWEPYAVSIAEVEQKTGYKFFPVVPDGTANAIKTHIDRGP